MGIYGCYVKFTARPGQRDALVEHLLSAASGLREIAGCQLYLINTSPTEPQSVWVTEVWQSQQEHDASLHTPDAQAAISRVLPLLAAPHKDRRVAYWRQRFDAGIVIFRVIRRLARWRSSPVRRRASVAAARCPG